MTLVLAPGYGGVDKAANATSLPSSRHERHGLQYSARAKFPFVRGNDSFRVQDERLPLVMLPGTLCDGRIFHSLARLLPGVHTEVVGYSDSMSIRQAAEQVLLHAPPRFALLGFSLGGMVAMEVALMAADRVRGVALISTSPLPVPLDRHALRRAAVQEAGTMAIEAFVRTRLWPVYCSHREENTPIRTLIEAMAISLGHSAFDRQTEMALQRPDYRPMLHAVRCPALVVAGAEDRLCPPEVQQALHAALPNCALHMIPGTGHLALVEKPDEVTAAVSAWFHTVLQAQSKDRPRHDRSDAGE